MPRKRLLALTLLVCSSASLALRGEDADANKQKGFPALQKPVAEVVDIDLKIPPNASDVKFEKGACAVVTGVVPWKYGLRLHDFELQRQTFSDKPEDPDKARWETVNIKDSANVILRVTDFQADLLPRQLISSVITEPLPRLKTGDWTEVAVHPSLRKALKDPPENTLQFRYLDFDVKAEHFYRYRVRLEYINPGYDRNIRPDQTTSSEWSKPTKLQRIKRAADSADQS